MIDKLCHSGVSFARMLNQAQRDARNKKAREWRQQNKEKSATQQKKYKDANKEKLKEARRLRKIKSNNREKDIAIRAKYGVSIDWYNEQLFLQNGVCAICLRPPAKGKSLCIDHNHLTGAVRNLLCHKCNVVLGLVNESKDVLKSMLHYLETHN